MTTKTPSAKSLNGFIQKGGYILLDRLGEGETTRDRQLDAWKRYGTLAKLQEQTHLSLATLRLIKEAYPTSSQSPINAEAFYILKEKLDLIIIMQEQISEVERTLKQAIKLLERSWIIDQINIRMQNEIGGIDIQQAFKNEIKRAQDGKSEVQQKIESIRVNLNQIKNATWDLKSSAKRI